MYSTALCNISNIYQITTNSITLKLQCSFLTRLNVFTFTDITDTFHTDINLNSKST